ncbi:MAG: Asp-tRNA(Asn)/Glu-tRNA(Gln) amidotransferase subunit GatC [Clostridia bacterium]|nr:Asp-tRNA(Asn)/Glu-tRNA(Gln) amidotransferase subunit GatC [Clostridia bacterium]MDD4685781.1 Asp-tRNA(Asn)/Glu-tRNA(Gln) amidotransferase subunit GatC [Clostridia bacterium]
MDITVKDVEYLANLSALSFSSDIEKQDTVKDLNNILKIINKLKEQDVDADNVFNKSHDLSELREDVVGKSLSQEEALANAPKQRRGCFNVPLVIE